MSRSAGRSAVAAAAYRFGMALHDERHVVTHDYTRRRGVECAFIVTPADAPEWAHDPQRLWNEAERAEKRINSRVAREAELALPAFLTAKERYSIVEEFSKELAERYGVAVAAAIHAPGRKGDQRNYHAHVMFTTRELDPEGFGRKTRILDDKKTGPQEVKKMRELAADIINRHLADANSDICVDHRSFKDRGIEREPTRHLGPAAMEMERRGENSDRGDINREAQAVNTLIEERNALDAEIAQEQEKLSNPPTSREDVLERMQDDLEPMIEAIETRGAIGDRPTYDGMKWWQRSLLRIRDRVTDFARALTRKISDYWQEGRCDDRDEQARDRDDGGLDR